MAALVVARLRHHLALAFGMSGVGFSLAVAYALLGAPDVALVAVLIETLFMLLFVAVFALLPRGGAAARGRAGRPTAPGGSATRSSASSRGSWSCWWCGRPCRGPPRPTPPPTGSWTLAGPAHGKDVVTVILADFRGLDTMVEITVAGRRPARGGRPAAPGEAVVTTV